MTEPHRQVSPENQHRQVSPENQHRQVSPENQHRQVSPENLNQELLNLASAAALDAGALILGSSDEARSSLETKSSRTDVVTEVDRRSEQLIVERLLTERPDDGILGEEGASVPSRSGITWVIDPIDGTTNFLYGHPHFAVSIAAQSITAETLAGVVYDPMAEELYAAKSGGGATRNGVPISCSDPAELATSLIGTGFSYDAETRRDQATTLISVLASVRDIRRMGAAAVDLCSVAAGRLDAYYERGVQPWDIAAGLLIAREAGATVGCFASEDNPDSPGLVIAAAQPIWLDLVALLESAGA